MDIRESTIDEQTGNVVCTGEMASKEDPGRLYLYRWRVANVVQPNIVQTALFSFTVLRGRMSEPETIEMVKLVERLVAESQFAKRVSVH